MWGQPFECRTEVDKSIYTHGCRLALPKRKECLHFAGAGSLEELGVVTENPLAIEAAEQGISMNRLVSAKLAL